MSDQAAASHEGIDRVVIDHEILKGVTSEMLTWWLGNHGPIEIYRLWNPEDHVAYAWLKTPEEAGGHVGAEELIWEWIDGVLTPLRIRFEDPRTTKVATIYKNVEVGVMIGLDGEPEVQTTHEYEDTPDGVRLRSTFMMTKPAGQKIVDSVRKHCVNEMAYLPSFLPQLYAEKVLGKK